MNSPGPLPPVDPNAPRHVITPGTWLVVALYVFLEAISGDVFWHVAALIALGYSVAAWRADHWARSAA